MTPLKFALLTLGAAILLSGCQTAQRNTTIAEIRPMTAKERADPSTVSVGTVLNIAVNRAQMSCLELLLGDIHAMTYSMAATSNAIKGDETLRQLASLLGAPSQRLINQEQKCHCDIGSAMAGYELFERRTHLFKTRKAKKPQAEFAEFYPRDENGQLRFLRYDEAISEDVLQQLPPVAIPEPYDDCGRSCRAARKRTNAAALAEGKEEPYPDLKRRPKAACIAATPAPPNG